MLPYSSRLPYAVLALYGADKKFHSSKLKVHDLFCSALPPTQHIQGDIIQERCFLFASSASQQKRIPVRPPTPRGMVPQSWTVCPVDAQSSTENPSSRIPGKSPRQSAFGTTGAPVSKKPLDKGLRRRRARHPTSHNSFIDKDGGG
jgi:hypothetical protein